MLEVVVTTGAIRRAKFQSNHNTNKPTPNVFWAGCPYCCPTNSVRALNERESHSKELLPKLTSGDIPTLSLTTKGSWLSWGRVAMLLINPLMPVPWFVKKNLTPAIWKCSALEDLWGTGSDL